MKRALLAGLLAGCSGGPVCGDPVEVPIDDGDYVEVQGDPATTPFGSVEDPGPPRTLTVAGDEVTLTYLDADGRTVRVAFTATPTR